MRNEIFHYICQIDALPAEVSGYLYKLWEVMKVLFNFFPLWAVSWHNVTTLVLLHFDVPKQTARVQTHKQESPDNILKQYDVITNM